MIRRKLSSGRAYSRTIACVRAYLCAYYISIACRYVERSVRSHWHVYTHTHTRARTRTRMHARTHTHTHIEGGDNRDANDGSSNNVMHFRSVFKLYKIRLRWFFRKRELIMSIVNAALSIREERVAMFSALSPPPSLPEKSCVDLRTEFRFSD